MGQRLAFLVIVFFCGPLGISNLWGYLQTRRSLTEAAVQNIRNVAALEASETLQFVRTIENLLPSLVAGNEHLFRTSRGLIALQDAPASARESLRAQLEAHLAAKVEAAESLDELQVVSPTGRVVSSTPSHSARSADPSSSACFRSGSRRAGMVGFEYPDHEAHGADPAEAGSHAEPQLLVAAPIVDSGGTFLGVLCGRFNFDVHRRFLTARSERTNQATLYLVDDRGTIMCGSFDDEQAALYGTSLASLGRPKPEAGAAWEARHQLESGTEVMLAYAPVRELGWGVVVEMPVALALAELERLKWQAAGASIALAMVLLVATFVSWRTVLRPLQALSRASDRMTSGVPGETVSPDGPRELVDLATAFNRMSLTLRDSQETLESRIAERTRELQESEEFLELLLDSIDQSVIVVNRSYEVIKTNAAAERIHGRPLVGETIFGVFEGAEHPAQDSPVLRTFKTGRPVSDERSQRTAQGTEAVHVETYPVFAADGEVESVVEIGRVITAEKHMQMQMIHQEKMAAFGQLAAGVAHEIGNPLAAIESQLQLAQGDPSRADHTLEIVRKQVARIARLLRELIDFTRRRDGESALASANQVIEDVTRLIEHDPRARRVRVVRTLAEDLPGIRTKEDGLVQVLLNMGLNSLDAMPEGGTLEFLTSADNGAVTIRVRDTGSGVSDAARAHLFEPFFTTKGPGRGTGLGLFVSKGIVEGMGGVVELERTGADGTVFAVRLRAERARADGTAS